MIDALPMYRLLEDPLVAAGIEAHGINLNEISVGQRMNGENYVEVGLAEDAPSIHIEGGRANLRWFTPELAVSYSIWSSPYHRKVQVESTKLPESIVAAAPGRVLAEIVDIPGAWKMDVLSAYTEDGDGITDDSTFLVVEPRGDRFCGDDDPAILRFLTAMGESRRGITLSEKIGAGDLQAFATRDRSYIQYPSSAGNVSYEVARNGREMERKVYLEAIYPDTVLGALIGKNLEEVVEIPAMGPCVITAAKHSPAAKMTILDIDPV